MKLGNERNLIPVISMLSRQSKSVDEALGLFQSALAGEIGDAALLIDSLEGGISPSVAKSTAAFLDSRQFPFRGLYTAPMTVGNRKIGRLVACFGSFGAPGKSLPALTSHVARQLSDILSRTSRAVTSLVSAPALQPAATSGEAA
jgi:hypothetical protein